MLISMDKVTFNPERLLSPIGSVYKKFENSIEKIGRYFLMPIFLLMLGFWIYKFFSPSVNEENFQEFTLKKEFKSSKFDNLDVYSEANFEKLIVTGIANIYGALSVRASTLKDLNVYGALRAKSVKMQDLNTYGFALLNSVKARDAEIYGFLKADRLNIRNGLVVAGSGSIQSSHIHYCELMGEQLYLEKTNIKKLKVFNNENKKVKIHMNLSHIGQLEFSNVKGEVFIYDAKSTVKTLKGGVIIKTEKKFPVDKELDK